MKEGTVLSDSLIPNGVLSASDNAPAASQKTLSCVAGPAAPPAANVPLRLGAAEQRPRARRGNIILPRGLARFMRHLLDRRPRASFVPALPGAAPGHGHERDVRSRPDTRTHALLRQRAGVRPGWPTLCLTDRPETGRGRRRTPAARLAGDSAGARAVRPCATLRAAASRESHAREADRGDARPHACTWAGLAAREPLSLRANCQIKALAGRAAARPAGLAF